MRYWTRPWPRPCQNWALKVREGNTFALQSAKMAKTIRREPDVSKKKSTDDTETPSDGDESRHAGKYRGIVRAMNVKTTTVMMERVHDSQRDAKNKVPPSIGSMRIPGRR